MSVSARILVVGTLLLFALLGPNTLGAQTYSIEWFTMDGGGGTSTGGVYVVTGTIGQHDAGGPSTNAQFSVIGGFWAWPGVVQTPGAPSLAIAPGAPGQAVVSWSPATPGFVLQEATSLENPDWVNSPSGATNPVNVPTMTSPRFYRLHKPPQPAPAGAPRP